LLLPSNKGSELIFFAEFLLKNNIDLEVIIISNDSTINEKRKLEKFKNLNKWIKVFYVSREPIYASWNRGVELAKNEIIGFWNVDDVRFPEAIINGIRLIKQGAELIYFPFIIRWYINFLGFTFLVTQKKQYILQNSIAKNLPVQCIVVLLLFLRNLFIKKLVLLMNNLK